MKRIEPIIRNLRKYFRNKTFHARFSFTRYYENLSVDDKAILIESFHGDDFNGAPFYILRELISNDAYSDLTKYIAVNESAIDSVRSLVIKQFGNRDDIRFVERQGDLYCRLLASAKFLVNNVSFPPYFIKKDEQVYLNTWHGTPLKALGRSIKDFPSQIGNVQRNFLMADYILCPSQYLADCLIKDYMIDVFYSGDYVFSGYPQNSVFYENESIKNHIKNELGIPAGVKKIVVYMPTWRDKQQGYPSDASSIYFNHALMEFERRLERDTLVFAKPHHLAEDSVEWSSYTKIMPFPEGFETYQILSIADVLVTDYSSVMFDFLNARKEILLYTYDEAEYVTSRSMYQSVSDLPFWHTDSPIELCNKINHNDGGMHDYKSFREKYCAYDAQDSAKSLCELLVRGDDSAIESVHGSELHNGKKNVLIYAGALLRNGITASLRGLLYSIDRSSANYTLLFYGYQTKNAADTINSLPPDVRFFSMQGQQDLTFLDSIARYFYFRLNSTDGWVCSRIDYLFDRERRRLFPSCNFDVVIHFTGYDRHPIHILNAFDQSKKIIYVHSDMLEEYERRGNFDFKSNKYAYQNWDTVAVVNDPLIDPLVNGFGVDRNKIKVLYNCNDLERIRRNGMKQIKYDPETIATVAEDELIRILKSSDGLKIINVGRFSSEKGQMRLIEAFQRFNTSVDRDSKLIIVGGHGPEYDSIASYIETNQLESVVLVQSLSNPYPLIAQSDVLALSSYYEGLPMVIFEALALGTPVMSTDIPGPSAFLSKGYGLVVDNSVEGLYDGFCQFARGKLHARSLDIDEFNKSAAIEFEKMIGVATDNSDDN